MPPIATLSATVTPDQRPLTRLQQWFWPPKSPATIGSRNLWLLYIGFMFLPALGGGDYQWLAPTLLTLPPFLFLYLRSQRHACGAGAAETVGIALLGFALTPWNWFSNTYFAYACGFLPFLQAGIARPLLLALGLIALQAIEILLLHQPLFLIGINLLVSAGSCAGNYFLVQNHRKNLALQFSHDEVHRLAATAERERIGRDLHDLLGHTLSLIAVSLELADCLADRDAVASRRELREAQAVARDALAQVRSAVTGIRSGSLAAELASSRVLLESSQIAFTGERDDTTLAPELETAVAMILREAVTNIHRHARARKAGIGLHREGDHLRIDVDDDGQGGIRTEGNGLTGMRERIAALHGVLTIDSPRGGGSHLCIRLPLQSKPETELRGAA